jgi:hypothetical protein
MWSVRAQERKSVSVRAWLHTTTNAEIIRRFLPVAIRIEQESELAWRVEV